MKKKATVYAMVWGRKEAMAHKGYIDGNVFGYYYDRSQGCWKCIEQTTGLFVLSADTFEACQWLAHQKSDAVKAQLEKHENDEAFIKCKQLVAEAKAKEN